MKKIVFSTFILLSSLFCFTGCYDAIFQAIRDEVELESATVSGFINGIVRFNVNPDVPFSADTNFDNQYIFAANGEIRYKKASRLEHGAWNEVSGNGLPDSTSYAYFDGKFNGMYLYNVAADSKYVYVIGFKSFYDDDNGRNVPTDYKVYYSEPAADSEGNLSFAEWKEISELSAYLSEYQSAVNSNDDDNYGMGLSIHLFGTSAVNPQHRAVFIRVGGDYAYLDNARNNTSDVYKLDGGTVTNVAKIKYSNSTETFESGGVDEAGYYYSELTRSTLSAVWFGDGYHFLNYVNANTNEGTLAGGAVAVENPTYVYFPYEGGVCAFKVSDYSANKDNFTKIFRGTLKPTHESVSGLVSSTSVGESILSMAVTNNSILLGSGDLRGTDDSNSSGGGIFKVVLESDGSVRPGSGTSDFSSNADSVMPSPYIVRALLCADPSLDESATSMYSSLDYIYTENTSGTSIKNRGLWSYYAERGNWNRE